MCGNGGRCAARFAVMHGIAPAKSPFKKGDLKRQFSVPPFSKGGLGGILMRVKSWKQNRIPFYKMHGGGNDFVLIDHRERFIPEAEQPQFARRVCHRQLGAGADGLILIEASPHGKLPLALL